jgi:hypothetical protein
VSYKLEVQSGEPIIWETWGTDFDPETDAIASVQEEIELLEAAQVPMVVVVDTRAVNLTFDDIIFLASNGVPDELNHHPRLGGMILITTSEVIAKSVEGLNSKNFGYIKMDVVASRDEALVQARKYLS